MNPWFRTTGMLALTLFGGCTGARPNSGSSASVNTRVVTEAGAYDLEMVPEEHLPTHWVRAPRPAVWAALSRVYQDLGVEVETINTEQWEMGNRNLPVSRRLGGQRLSTYLNCGVNPIGAPAADVWAVQLSLVTRATGDEAGTTLHTWVSASARPRSNSGAPARCNSTGKLEARIADMVRRQTSP